MTTVTAIAPLVAAEDLTEAGTATTTYTTTLDDLTYRTHRGLVALIEHNSARLRSQTVEQTEQRLLELTVLEF